MLEKKIHQRNIQHSLCEEVLQERSRQDKKWGVQNHAPLYWSGILTEETGEVAKACIEYNNDAYREELIQVAAVAIAALECYDRANKT